MIGIKIYQESQNLWIFLIYHSYQLNRIITTVSVGLGRTNCLDERFHIYEIKYKVHTLRLTYSQFTIYVK